MRLPNFDRAKHRHMQALQQLGSAQPDKHVIDPVQHLLDT
jgi:hypothetical protein